MRLAYIATLAVALAGCGQIANDVATACAIEQNAHAAYVAFIAKLRPATAVAREAAFYAKVQNLCAVGASLGTIQAATANASAARAQ